MPRWNYNTNATQLLLEDLQADLAATNVAVASAQGSSDLANRAAFKSGGARGRYWAAGESFTNGSTTLQGGWFTVVSGAGTGAASGSVGNARWDGRAAPSSGTALGGRSAVARFNSDLHRPGSADDGVVFFDVRLYPLQLGTASENFYVAAGIGDLFAGAGGLGDHGVFLYYESQTSVNWRVLVRKVGVTTHDYDTGVVVVAGPTSPSDHVGFSIEVDYVECRVYHIAQNAVIPTLLHTIQVADLPTAGNPVNSLGSGGFKIENLTTRAAGAFVLLDHLNTGRMPVTAEGYQY